MADLLRDHRPKLGHSGHENTYRQNVLVGNWAEDRSAKESPNLPGLPIVCTIHPGLPRQPACHLATEK